ncbi:hypothetical protein ACTU44_21865 (plasmid) [Thalassospira sp. SM2505]
MKLFKLKPKKEKKSSAAKAFKADIEHEEDPKDREVYEVHSVLPGSPYTKQGRFVIFLFGLVALLSAYNGVQSYENSVLARNQTRVATSIVQISPASKQVITLRQTEDLDVKEAGIATYLPVWLRHAREFAGTLEEQTRRVQSNKKVKCASPLFWLTDRTFYNSVTRDMNKRYPAFRNEYGEGAIVRLEIGDNTPQKLSDKGGWYYLDFVEVWEDPRHQEILRKPRRVQARIAFEDLEMPKCGVDQNPVGLVVKEAYFNDR